MPGPWERLLRSVARTRLRDASDGQIKIVGQLRYVSPPRKAPLSGRTVGAYHVAIIAHLEAPDADGARTRVLVDERYCGDFLVDDGSGVARVQGAGAALSLDIDVSHSPWFSGAHPAVGELLAARGVHVDDLPSGARIQGYEGVLVEDETVVVCGKGRFEADPHGPGILDYRQGAAMRYVIAGDAANPALVSDERELVAAGRVE